MHNCCLQLRIKNFKFMPSGSCCFLLLNDNPILNRWINSYKIDGVPQWWMCCSLESIDLMPRCGGGLPYSTGWGAEMHCILESTNFNSDNSLILYVYNMDNKTKRKVVSKSNQSSQSFSIFGGSWNITDHTHTHSKSNKSLLLDVLSIVFALP